MDIYQKLVTDFKHWYEEDSQSRHRQQQNQIDGASRQMNMRRNRIFKKNVNVNVTHKSIDCNSNLLNENRDHKLTNNRLDSEKCQQNNMQKHVERVEKNIQNIERARIWDYKSRNNVQVEQQSGVNKQQNMGRQRYFSMDSRNNKQMQKNTSKYRNSSHQKRKPIFSQNQANKSINKGQIISTKMQNNQRTQPTQQWQMAIPSYYINQTKPAQYLQFLQSAHPIAHPVQHHPILQPVKVHLLPYYSEPKTPVQTNYQTPMHQSHNIQQVMVNNGYSQKISYNSEQKSINVDNKIQAEQGKRQNGKQSAYSYVRNRKYENTHIKGVMSPAQLANLIKKARLQRQQI